MRFSVVIIGLGHQSLHEHIPALLRRNDVRIVGACDPSPTAAANFEQLHPVLAQSIPTYTDLQELLDNTRPQLAVIAVPHDSYLDIVTELCKRNIYFLKEKPLARNLAEAKELLSIPNFEQYGYIAAQRRYGTLYQQAKEALKHIGQPYLFNGLYRLNIESPHSGWRGQKKIAGGGCLIDMGYHIVDQLLWWFGEPERINAQVSSLASHVELDPIHSAEDSATVSFRYKNGMHGVILVSRAAGEKVEKYGVYGPNGYIEGSKTMMSVYDRQGHLLKQLEQDNPSAMIDAQFDFFISRVEAHQNFTDIQQQHLANMHFIERCYQDALDEIRQTTVGL